MIRRAPYIVLLLAGCWLLSGCKLFQKKTNWNVSLNRKEKKPYGGYLAYESLKFFFPGAEIHPLSSAFRYSSIDHEMTENGRSLLIAVGLDFYLSETELQSLIRFAKKGNEVFIFSRNIDEKLEHYLGCTIRHSGLEEQPLTKDNDGTVNLNALHLRGEPGRSYGYQGKPILASFSIKPPNDEHKDEDKDEETEPGKLPVLFEVPDTLGYAQQQPDFLRYKVGKGHFYLHAAPLVLSNYFLLQPGNQHYLQGLWQTLPEGIGRIYWNDYYKRSNQASDLGVLLKYPGTRWALIFAMFALLMYVLFEGKRKQRIVPVVKPLENSSVSFVETVGRLYFNKGDHQNLAEKMVQHFLEWVRTHYFLNTNELNDQFQQQLIVRSGMPEAVVRSLMELIREVMLERKQIDQHDLYHLHTTIQQFYKNHNNSWKHQKPGI